MAGVREQLRNLLSLVDEQKVHEIIKEGLNSHLDDVKHGRTRIGKRNGAWWSTKPGTLKQVLEGQQINPLVLWIVKVESMPNSSLNGDGDRKYLWRMTVSDGKYYFHDAYLTTRHNHSTKRINATMTVPCEILVLNYCFKVKELPHVKAPLSNRLAVLELLTVCEISQASAATPYDQSFCQSLLDTELTNDLLSAWLHDQPDVGSQVVKRVTACERVIDMGQSENPRNLSSGLHMSLCHDTSTQLGSSDSRIVVAADANASALVESAIRRVKRGLKRRSNFYWEHLTPRNTLLKRATKRKNDARYTVYASAPYRPNNAAKGIDQSVCFNVSSKQYNSTRQCVGKNEYLLTAQLIDEHKSLLYHVCAVGIAADGVALFPVHKLMDDVIIAPQCRKLRITAFKFDAESLNDQSNPVEHVGTFTCDIDGSKNDQFLNRPMLNPRTGDIVFAFDEADRQSHGLYYVRLPSSSANSRGKVKDRAVSLQPIQNTGRDIQWPGAVTHYIEAGHWLWRHNGEQLITLLRAPDRVYVVIFRLNYRSEDNANDSAVPTVVDAKFISWFESDTPPQVLSSWPPKLLGSYGPFLIFQAGDGGFDLFCVPLFSRDLDSLHTVTPKLCVLLNNFNDLIIAYKQHLTESFNHSGSKSAKNCKPLGICLHPGGVVIFSLSICVENKLLNCDIPLPVFIRCDISNLLNNCARASL